MGYLAINFVSDCAREERFQPNWLLVICTVYSCKHKWYCKCMCIFWSGYFNKTRLYKKKNRTQCWMVLLGFFSHHPFLCCQTLTHTDLLLNTFCHSHIIANYISDSSLRIYSPTSAWWNVTIVVGSACLHSWVDLAATPKP